MYSLGAAPLRGTEMPFEMDLCSLLQTMKIESPTKDTTGYASFAYAPRDSLLEGLEANKHDDSMDEANYHSDGGSEYSNSSSSSDNNIAPAMPSIPQDEVCGCAYLQAIREQFDQHPSSIGSAYLEAIFTHREILLSFPAAHRDCARAFSGLAILLERTAWSAERNADTDVITAFRHEAWMIASTLSPPAPAVQPTIHSNFGCIMPPMY